TAAQCATGGTDRNPVTVDELVAQVVQRRQQGAGGARTDEDRRTAGQHVLWPLGKYREIEHERGLHFRLRYRLRAGRRKGQRAEGGKQGAPRAKARTALERRRQAKTHN